MGTTTKRRAAAAGDTGASFQLTEPEILQHEINSLTFNVQRLQCRLDALDRQHNQLMEAYRKHCKITHGGWTDPNRRVRPMAASRTERRSTNVSR